MLGFGFGFSDLEMGGPMFSALTGGAPNEKNETRGLFLDIMQFH